METKETLKRKPGLKNFKSAIKLFYSKKDPDYFRPSGIVCSPVLKVPAKH